MHVLKAMQVYSLKEEAKQMHCNTIGSLYNINMFDRILYIGEDRIIFRRTSGISIQIMLPSQFKLMH